jgi:hypothetical protein
MHLVGDTVKVHRLASGKPSEQLERFVELLRTVLWVDAFVEGTKLMPSIIPEPNSNDEPSTTEDVEGRDLTRNDPGSPSCKWGHHGSNAEPTRCAGNCRHRDPGVANGETGFTEHVIPQEDAIPAGLLSGDGELDNGLRVSKLMKRWKEDSKLHL